MEFLSDEAKAAEQLKCTSLRDFDVAADVEAGQSQPPIHKFSVDDAPVPDLYKYALMLIGCQACGPAHKTRWRVEFTFRGERCQMALEKFGLHIYLQSSRSAPDVLSTQQKISEQLKSSTTVVEELLRDNGLNRLRQGHVTVLNQHQILLRAYVYFRDRTLTPAHIADEWIHHTPDPDNPSLQATSFIRGRVEMHLNALHDMVAAITAYMSLLEHDFVLALGFSNFDPDTDDLAAFIGFRWGKKWQRILGTSADAQRYRQRLTQVAERWRNPYAHGGFEKGLGSTVFVHTPIVGAALPVGLSAVRWDPRRTLGQDSDQPRHEIFALFDEIDAWIVKRLPDAVSWIQSGLDVRYDEAFQAELRQAGLEDGGFARLLSASQFAQERWDNMDF